jgi:hypothetical protein
MDVPRRSQHRSPPCVGYLISAFSHTLYSDALLIPPRHIYSAIMGLSSYFSLIILEQITQVASTGLLHSIHLYVPNQEVCDAFLVDPHFFLLHRCY